MRINVLNSLNLIFVTLIDFFMGYIYSGICRDSNMRPILQFYRCVSGLHSFYGASVFALVDEVIVSSSLSCFNNRILRSASKASTRSEKLKTLAVHRVYRSSSRAPAKQVFPSYRARIVFRCNKDSVSLEGWATFASWKRTFSLSPD